MYKVAVNVEEYSVNAAGNPYNKDKDKAKDEKINAIIDSQYRSLKGLKMGYESVKQEVLKTQQIFSDEVNQFGKLFAIPSLGAKRVGIANPFNLIFLKVFL